MAHTRQDTLTPPPEWWKHLRPFNKRHVSKRERRAGRETAASDLSANDPAASPARNPGSIRAR
jgi:hypothetical protein